MNSPFSILDIGDRINSIGVAYDELDETQPADRDSIMYDRHETKMRILLDETMALQHLVVALRPKTLAEAAVQLAILFHDMFSDCDSDNVQELQASIEKIKRVTAGAIRVVATDAGIDVSQFAPPCLGRLMEAVCPEQPDDQGQVVDQAERVRW
jgi:hypothetical protein